MDLVFLGTTSRGRDRKAQSINGFNTTVRIKFYKYRTVSVYITRMPIKIILYCCRLLLFVVCCCLLHVVSPAVFGQRVHKSLNDAIVVIMSYYYIFLYYIKMYSKVWSHSHTHSTVP